MKRHTLKPGDLIVRYPELGGHYYPRNDGPKHYIAIYHGENKFSDGGRDIIATSALTGDIVHVYPNNWMTVNDFCDMTFIYTDILLKNKLDKLFSSKEDAIVFFKEMYAVKEYAKMVYDSHTETLNTDGKKFSIIVIENAVNAIFGHDGNNLVIPFVKDEFKNDDDELNMEMKDYGTSESAVYRRIIKQIQTIMDNTCTSEVDERDFDSLNWKEKE